MRIKQQGIMGSNIIRLPFRAVVLLWLLSATLAATTSAAAKHFFKPGHGLPTGTSPTPSLSPAPAHQKLVVWGDDLYGIEDNVPDSVRTGNVQYLTASSGNAAVVVDGVLTVWGDSFFGLNTVTGTTGVVAVALKVFDLIYLLDNGTVVAGPPGGAMTPQVPEAAQSNVIAISADFPHYLALRDDGTVVEWGQHRAPAGLSDVTAVAAGGASMALLRNGSVVVWGDDKYGQISGQPAGLAHVAAVAAAPGRCLALLKNGTVVMWGTNPNNGAVPLTAQSNVVAIAAGGHLSIALLRDGSVIQWGLECSTKKLAYDNAVRIAGGDFFGLALLSAAAPSGGAGGVQRPAADDA